MYLGVRNKPDTAVFRFTACHITVSGSVSTDDEEEAEDTPARKKRRFPKDKFHAV